MAKEQKWMVSGTYKDTVINETIAAYSDRQAKSKAGMKNGIRGKELTEFMRSSNIRVVRRI